MKRKFEIAKTLFSWLVMTTFLVVGVFAVVENHKVIKYQTRLKFQAVDVKAEVLVYEGFGKSDILANAEYKDAKSVKINEETTTLDDVVLGENGVIEFKSSTPHYFLKIAVENQFKEGGRDIWFYYELNYDYFDDLENFDVAECEPSISGVVGDIEFADDDKAYVIAPKQVLTLVFIITLDTDMVDSFETENGFELLNISLKRA